MAYSYYSIGLFLDYRGYTIIVTCLGFIASQGVQCSVSIRQGDETALDISGLSARLYDTKQEAYDAARECIDEAHARRVAANA